MSLLEKFYDGCEGKQLEILLKIRSIMENYPSIIEKYRFKIPFYYGNTWICYTNPIKKGGVELAFVRANEIEDPLGILESRGRKMVKGIRYYQLSEVDETIVHIYMQLAIDLDNAKPYTFKKKKVSPKDETNPFP